MIILDSSFLIAYHNRRDVHHEAAARVMEDLLKEKWGEVLLPEYVVLEVMTVLARRRDLTTAVAVGDLLLKAKEIEFVPCTDIFVAAFDYFRSQKTGRLSFVDAALVALARGRNAQYLVTFDSGFEGLEGLTIVPGR